MNRRTVWAAVALAAAALGLSGTSGPSKPPNVSPTATAASPETLTWSELWAETFPGVRTTP